MMSKAIALKNYRHLKVKLLVENLVIYVRHISLVNLSRKHRLEEIEAEAFPIQ